MKDTVIFVIKTAVLSLILSLLMMAQCSAMLKFTAIDVGQGDSILIETDTQNILVDTGPPESREKLMAGISHVEKIDKLILTHPHADHVGNAFYLIENFPVGFAYDNGEISASSYYLNYLAVLSMENIDRVSLKSGDKLTVDGAVLEILNPSSEVYDVNNNSLVFRLTYGNFSMLFTGDIGYLAEAKILSCEKNIRATVLKAAHHGSATSSSYNFLQSVSPEVVIITCGAGNRFNHPSVKAVSTFKRISNNIYCTAFNGSVTVKTDGISYTVSPEITSDWLDNFPATNEVTIVNEI